MKIKKGFILREISKEEGISVVVAVGSVKDKLNGYITLNESGALIFKTLQNGAEVSDVVNELLKVYEVDREVLEKDVLFVINKLKEICSIEPSIINCTYFFKFIYNK